MAFDFHCPTRIIYGPGRIAELGTLTAALGVKRVLVVSDPGIEKAGHTARGVESLHTAGLETHVFDGLQENPTTENVDAGLAVATDFSPDAIVAIGGGSSMDCAKGINFVYSCGGRMQDYWGVGKATADMLPMVAVPTTSGTGSETQSFALISDAETHVKMACGDKRAAFRVALLDPELTLTQPQRVTALTGIDALAHTLETFVTKKRNAMSVAYSREAWALLSPALPRILAEPDNLQARCDMQLGAMFAGLAIENSMLGSAHASANPLTAEYGVVHGEAVGLMLPHIIRHNAQSVGPWYEDLSSQSPSALADFVAQLARQAGLAGTLQERGIERHRLEHLAVAATKQWTGTFNPIELSEQDYLFIYEAAYE
ncbi:iron-containing alcohol dehydrogenase [Aeoliella sp. ICT_H6.2]|uniref:Iron-containing alcohol dehydrogenase n=1 Tax=Aeoliella straminimaris TaxID=2954799 RepID=A0A9X2FAN0_9BACT|nr:iron-containing alcohol dehydrogenase [Aeoliella straminimaris]MCO6042471.1 iron-containing alcohol dehydrogenase [Aeoliella straminimaris]